MLTGGQIQAALDQLLACVAGELLPAPCVQYVSVGPPALDHCCDEGDCDGQLTVHLVSLLPVTDQLQRRTPTVLPCRPGAVGLDVRAVLGRCHPTLDGQALPPDPVALDDAAAQLSDDAAAIARAVACCGLPAALSSVDVSQPPSGGCSLLIGSLVVDPTDVQA